MLLLPGREIFDSLFALVGSMRLSLASASTCSASTFCSSDEYCSSSSRSCNSCCKMQQDPPRTHSWGVCIPAATRLPLLPFLSSSSSRTPPPRLHSHRLPPSAAAARGAHLTTDDLLLHPLLLLVMARAPSLTDRAASLPASCAAHHGDLAGLLQRQRVRICAHPSHRRGPRRISSSDAWAGSLVLTVDYCIKVHLDLQEDKSSVIVKGPFLP
jgi:hypothetical protein